jgi:hypothetical protein
LVDGQAFATEFGESTYNGQEFSSGSFMEKIGVSIGDDGHNAAFLEGGMAQLDDGPQMKFGIVE